MNKIKTSMKICKQFEKVFTAGGNSLSEIIVNDPVYYNCGIYGWNCDLYVDYGHDMIITTGYRNTRGRRIPYELIEEFNEKARQIPKFDIDTMEKRETLQQEFFDRLAKL